MLNSRSLLLVIWTVAPLLTGIWAVLLGQDANWDLRNYHYYNAFAFVTGRQDFDVAPGQVASYYNPLLHIPLYYAISTLPPIVVGFLVGAIQGLNFPLLFLIARRVIHLPSSNATTIAALSVAALGLTGAGFRSEVGASFGDNFISTFVLGSMLLVLIAMSKHNAASWRHIVVAGFVAGCAAGLKQPAAIFAVGLCGALLLRDGDLRRNFTVAFVFGCAVLTGLAATGGFWMWELWQRYGSPLFPYFNQAFQSPWATLGDYRDTRFLPASLAAILLFPFYFIYEPQRMTEIWFQDFRIPLLYIGVIAVGLDLVWQRFTPPPPGAEPPPTLAPEARYVLAVIALSYLAWLKMFAIHRYLIGVEILAPLGLWLVLARLCRDWRSVAFGFSMVALILLATTSTRSWGRVAYQDDYFGVTPPRIAQPKNALVLMAGFEPMAYLIPFFPHDVRFLRIQSWFTGPSAQPNGFDRLMHQAVQRHRGDIYALFRHYERHDAEPAYRSYGLHIDDTQCQDIVPHIADEDDRPTTDPFQFCLLLPTTRQP